MVGPSVLSDRGYVFLDSKHNIVKNYTEHTLYDFRESNMNNFVDDLSKTDFAPMFNSNCIDDKLKFLYDALSNAMERIPRVIVHVSKKSKPWITPKVKFLIDQRWAAYR